MLLSVLVTDYHVLFSHAPTQEKSDSIILLIYEIALISVYRLLFIISPTCLSDIFQENTSILINRS